MIEPLFFLYVALSVISYGLHAPLLIKCARKHNPVVVTTYRNLSYALTMLPLLLFVSVKDLLAISQHLDLLIFAALFATASFICNMTAGTLLPYGVGAPVRSATTVMVVLLLSTIVLSEVLSLWQIMLVIVLVLLTSGLSFFRTNHAHLDSAKHIPGVLFAVGSGICAAIAFFFFAKLAQAVHPFVATYSWEVLIGIIALLYMVFTKKLNIYKGTMRLSLNDTVEIGLSALPAISGTVFYALAVNTGPFALASGLAVTSIMVGTLMSFFLLKERLSIVQCILICLIILVLGSIKLLS